MLYNSRTQAEYDALPDAIKAEYKKTGEHYTLQHDEDVGALKRAKERVDQSLADTRADRDVIKAQNDALQIEVKKTGTPAQIAAEARAAALAEAKPQLERAARLENTLKTQTLSATATTIAKQIGGDKNVVALLPSVERRIEVQLGDDDSPKVIVKGPDGKATTLTTDDLVKEFRGDKNYASLVVVEAGSGGQGRQQQQPQFPGRQSPAGGAGTVKPVEKMNSAERQAYIVEKYVMPTKTAVQ